MKPSSSALSLATWRLKKHFHLLIFSALLPPLQCFQCPPHLCAHTCPPRDLNCTPGAMALCHQRGQTQAARNSMMPPASLPASKYSLDSVSIILQLPRTHWPTYSCLMIAPISRWALKAQSETTIHAPSEWGPQRGQIDHYLLQCYLQGRTSTTDGCTSFPLSMSL